MKHVRDFSIALLCLSLFVGLVTGTLVVQTECGIRTTEKAHLNACNHQVGFAVLEEKPKGAQQ